MLRLARNRTLLNPFRLASTFPISTYYDLEVLNTTTNGVFTVYETFESLGLQAPYSIMASILTGQVLLDWSEIIPKF